jgi:sigma-B regulation protein RsbU (phosphoserine phosphatase)
VRKNGELELLEEGGTVLGLIPGVRYNRAQAEIRPGDVLVLYTDGVIEAANAAGEMYGVEGLARSVEATFPDTNPEVVLNRVLSDAREVSAGAPAADDQTLVVISPDK